MDITDDTNPLFPAAPLPRCLHLFPPIRQAPPLDGTAVLPLSVAPTSDVKNLDDTQALTTRGIETIQVLHLVNGEHYSGAERVQDLLARQLPQFGCEVGFACVKPRRFPAARESKQAPLVEMPMRGRFDLRVVKRIAELVRRKATTSFTRTRRARPWSAGWPRAARACRLCTTCTARPAATRRDAR